MNEVRIIGIGSPFGDDSIGWDAIDAIDGSGMLGRWPPGMVETVRCDHPAVSLLPLMSGARAAILIDGMRSGAVPGSLRKIDAGELPPGPVKMSSHGMSVPEHLALGRQLGLLPEAVVIYGIEIGCAGAAPGAQDNVRAAIPALLHELAFTLQALLSE